MGNKMGKKRQVVDDKYTRPQGLYQHRDIDYKKLRKLILDAKLAPCYPGLEDCAFDLEECPICFLYYPSLNRSRCCLKGICTECFLQMKPPHSTRPTQCPFCKISSYAVEYHGAKTKEEKGMEQVEEQKVIEAQIRIQQKELQDEEERMKKKQDTSSSNRTCSTTDVKYHDTNTISGSVPSLNCSRQSSDFGLSQVTCSIPPTSAPPLQSRQSRVGNFDLDLDDIMVMEAIWLSIQEQGSQSNPGVVGNFFPGPSTSGEWNHSLGGDPIRSSPSGGLAFAAAALAERQQMNGELAPYMAATASYDMLQPSGSLSAGNVRFTQNSPPSQWNEMSPDSRREVPREEFGETSNDRWSEVAEAGTSYAGSEGMVESGATSIALLGGTNMDPGHFVPESFEEQMMLAMAVSLAEARASMGSPGLGGF